MRRRGKQDPLAGVNLLEIAPTRRAEWEEAGSRIVVIRPEPTTSGARLLLDRLLYQLSARRIRLDEYGSCVWRYVDGKRTVADIAAALREEYGDVVEPAEERVGKLIQVFRREEFVAYPGVDRD
ncbi:MAG: PqqD family protein [Gemmatimonadota bacterium]|nr:PqqD family protein [Gemmatimonadota bacterium]MDH3369192.1 PqqD family protein [Gemmatimonadota bacterium]MDH3478391.1 PqqD family protein [Gemmatimonadota bacterium]MDH3570072.1 PqqD family protein [Gemmatimonadota bacterium]MDH5548939.1 PqqD family protein [Gemmatimonadota bacterium]